MLSPKLGSPPLSNDRVKEGFLKKQQVSKEMFLVVLSFNAFSASQGANVKTMKKKYFVLTASEIQMCDSKKVINRNTSA